MACPIVLTPTQTSYVVSVPDLNINTQGTDIAEAIYIGLWNPLGLSRSESNELVTWVRYRFR